MRLAGSSHMRRWPWLPLCHDASVREALFGQKFLAVSATCLAGLVSKTNGKAQNDRGVTYPFVVLKGVVGELHGVR